MAMATDLAGLGLPPRLAAKLAEGGSGDISISAAGSTYATSTVIKPEQRVVSCTNADGTLALGLPVVNGTDGPLLCDAFVINNAGTTSLQIFGSSAVLINMNGSNNSQQPIQSHRTAIMYPVSTTQWIAISG